MSMMHNEGIDIGSDKVAQALEKLDLSKERLMRIDKSTEH